MKQTVGDGVVEGAQGLYFLSGYGPCVFYVQSAPGPDQFQPSASAKASTGAVAGWTGLIAFLQVGI